MLTENKRYIYFLNNIILIKFLIQISIDDFNKYAKRISNHSGQS